MALLEMEEITMVLMEMEEITMALMEMEEITMVPMEMGEITMAHNNQLLAPTQVQLHQQDQLLLWTRMSTKRSCSCCSNYFKTKDRINKDKITPL